METIDKVNEYIDNGREAAKKWMYYFIIGIVSFITLVFLPMIGSTAGLEWAVPTTPVGWIVWISIKIIVAAINVLIFHCFIMQGKSNAKNHLNYKKAKEILNECAVKEEIPISPREWTRNTYLKKGIAVFITTAMGAIALSQAILTFDWVSMLTYLFTIIMGIILGVLQQKSTEEWWTEDFLKYAEYVQKKAKKTAKNEDSIKYQMTYDEYVENLNSLLEENKNVN